VHEAAALPPLCVDRAAARDEGGDLVAGFDDDRGDATVFLRGDLGGVGQADGKSFICCLSSWRIIFSAISPRGTPTIALSCSGLTRQEIVD